MSTTGLARQAALEIRRQWYSGLWAALAGVMLLSTLAAFSGSVSLARSEHARFVADVAAYAARGLPLADALAAPVHVTREGATETIDNPLKYDYLHLGELFHSVSSPSAMIGTSLEFATFLVLPLCFIFVGAAVATLDRSAGTLKLRASRDGFGDIMAGKLASLVVAAVVAVAMVALCASLVAVLGAVVVDGLREDLDIALLAPAAPHPLALKLLFAAGVAVFFGLVGLALGALTRSVTWPLVACALALFVLPFTTRWDPRNLLAVVGAQVFDFWGQFQLRPPIAGVSPGGAFLALTAVAGAAAALAVVFPRPKRRYS